MLNIPKTQWAGVVPDPVPLPFSHQKSKKFTKCAIFGICHIRWMTQNYVQRFHRLKPPPLEEHLKEVFVLQTQAYQRVSASSSSAFDATQCSPVLVISRFQKGARDLR